MEPVVLRPREAAAYLNLSLKALRRLPVKRVRYNQRTFRYLKADLDAWLRTRAA